MRTLALCLVLLCVSASVFGLAVGEEGILFRSNVNGDGDVNISDVVYLNNFLFNGGPEPICLRTADFDDSGEINVTDSIGILNWLFNGGYGPASPQIVPECSM